MPSFEGFSYFLQIVREHLSLQFSEQRKPELILFGSAVPEALVRASGAPARYILGGSFSAAAWSDDAVPRDADPISRSSLGYLLHESTALTDHALILIPMINDNNRKIAYLLKASGKKVHTIEIPPVNDRFAAEKWSRQLDSCAEAIEKHTGKRISLSARQNASRDISHTRKQLRHFVRLCGRHPEQISGVWRMFILFSYYCAENLMEWSQRLEEITAWLEGCPVTKTVPAHNRILLLGSPIYFPNYKLPFLIQDVGLQVNAVQDYTTQGLLARYASDPLNVSDADRVFIEHDCSPSHPRNTALSQAVSRLTARVPVDGVVCHVLKGQIEYDFEAERLESLFAQAGLPVIRLETDYHHQDIEQLRLRLEAFQEVLGQNHYRRKEAFAV